MKIRKFAFRISESDYQMLKTKASRAKITMTDFAVRSIMGKEIVVIGNLKEFISELKALGRNLNQLTVLANMGRISVVNLAETKKKLDEIYGVLQVGRKGKAHGDG